jgi:hypothetical protein
LPFEIRPERILLSRVKFNDSLPESIKDKIAQEEAAGIFTGLIGPEKSGDEYLLAELGSIKFDQELQKEEKEELKALALNLYQDIIFKNYLDSLRASYKTKVNQGFEDYLNRKEN